MSSHAHEFSPHGPLPDAICPGIEVLVHRRATELIAEQPQRRRIATLSSVGGVAVAAVCAVLVLAIGSPSGGGLLTARQAVAAVVQSLNGNGVLHWVREERVTGAPGDPSWPERIESAQWLDLSSGNSRTMTKTFRQGTAQPEAQTDWVESGLLWERQGSQGAIRRAAPVSTTAVDELRAMLERADRGEGEIASAGEHAGKPVVVVTERRNGTVRRVWITREDVPQVLRSEVTIPSRNAPRPVVATTTTKTWQIVPRTPESLGNVEIPTDAKRVP